MHKGFFYTIIFLLFCSGLFGQDDNNPDHVLFKKNKVKSVKVIEYRYRNGKARGKGKLLFDRSYNKDGLLIESDSYVMGKFHEEYRYNEKGELIEDIGYVVGDPVSNPYTYKYDGKGRIIETTEGPDKGKWYYKYDTAGNKTEIKWLYMGASEPNSYFIDKFEYNAADKMVKMVRYNAGGSVYFYKTETYDASGNLTEEIRFENNDTTDIWNYHYDSKGNCIENETFDKLKNKLNGWYKANYDDKGLTIDITGQLNSEERMYYRKYVYEFYD